MPIYDLGKPRHGVFDVYIGQKWIDTVFWDLATTAEEVRRALIEHDRYDPRIKVIKRRLPK